MPEDHFNGVCWAMLNNFLAVGDRLLQRLMLSKDQSPVDISKTGVTFLNNSLGCIPIFLAAYLTSEFDTVPSAMHELDTQGWVLVVLSCIVSVGICYTGIWVQSLITATSFLVLVNASKFGVIFLEAYVMKEKTLQPMQVLGSCTTILAGIAYGKAPELSRAARPRGGGPRRERARREGSGPLRGACRRCQAH